MTLDLIKNSQSQWKNATGPQVLPHSKEQHKVWRTFHFPHIRLLIHLYTE